MLSNNIELLLACIEKGDKDAAEEMGYKYARGDEENGIFINHKKAKEYYDLAGVAFSPRTLRMRTLPVCAITYCRDLKKLSVASIK